MISELSTVSTFYQHTYQQSYQQVYNAQTHHKMKAISSYQQFPQPIIRIIISLLIIYIIYKTAKFLKSYHTVDNCHKYCSLIVKEPNYKTTRRQEETKERKVVN